MHLPADWQKIAKDKKKRYISLLKKSNQREMIKMLPVLHEEAFTQIDCLQCANCCKNHSPRFKQPDIKRIAKYLGMKEGEFVQQYLVLDEDNDFVNKQLPCPFLETDNTCRIYDVRPSDCARYPYSDEDVFVKRTSLTATNSAVCPAVFSILEKMINRQY